MAMGEKNERPKPRLARGFRDVVGAELAARYKMIETIRRVYELYGFAPLETPTVEFADMLGKFIQETGLPDEGVFSFKADQPEWLALRYDLTAPLSRYFAQHRDLPRPFRRYQIGSAFRIEKPGPGRFREFIQFDIDTVGSASMAADAEICCVLCDAFDALGLAGRYVVRVGNRRVLNGVLEASGVDTKADGGVTSTRVMRCVDKFERLGLGGVVALLRLGRMDESGDFTEGAGLTEAQVAVVTEYLKASADTRRGLCEALGKIVGQSQEGKSGVDELKKIDEFLTAAGYDEQRVVFDPTIVRGLTYYTGPVYEASLKDEKGNFTSSIAGGGRYDNLIERFTGQKVPATGASIGVDRLLDVLKGAERIAESVLAPVLVTQMDERHVPEYTAMVFELRRAGIPAELFLGRGNIGKQLKYADQRNIPLAVIAGDDEFATNSVSIKDLRLGAEVASEVGERSEWLKHEQTQETVPREELVERIAALLAKYSSGVGADPRVRPHGSERRQSGNEL
ncbi:MAG: histidine--tRNA ligase [Candidatus Coatesbacteria bacterium]|nr:histidine--tRNA ligase [Candidatus Coatesbacteria bacterium]